MPNCQARTVLSLVVVVAAICSLAGWPLSGQAKPPARLALQPVLSGVPIWAAGQATSGTVALFRHAFVVPAGLAALELAIVADTRYEMWLDGQWLGRGPARFSRVRQEFDTYDLELMPGAHLLAVLVHYAPNVRRSESLRPALQASVQGWNGSAWVLLAATGTTWKATVSPAWDSQVAPVSQLQLIGPMEILDLRQLPAGWPQPGFDDSGWPGAQQVSPSPFSALSPRSIPMLAQVERVPVAVVDSGLLSPGWQMVELEGPASGPSITHTLVVTAQYPTFLRLESLEPGTVLVDGGQALTWQALVEERRPDVMAAELPLQPGTHTLSLAVPAAQSCSSGRAPTFSLQDPHIGASGVACSLSAGRTLAFQRAGLLLPSMAGVHPTHDPGRRTLLANPLPGGAGAPAVTLQAAGAEAHLPAAATPRYLVLDFGQTIHARLLLEAEGPAGTIVDAGWDERLTAGRPLPAPGSLVSNLWSQVDSWVLDGTPRPLTTLDTRAGRYLLLQVWGPGPVTLRAIRAIEEGYPVEQVGSFASSDPVLDQIWQVGVDTVRPNMTDAYTDTPWRERGQWWGDAMIAFYANRAAFGDLGLLRRGLRQMADGIDGDGRPPALVPNWPGGFVLDFGMSWLEGLYLYWKLSGDLSFVAELYPAAERLTGFLAGHEAASGLMDVPLAHWSQSALVDWSAVSSRSGESTALNAQYASLLGQMSELAQALGRPAQAQAYQARGEAVRQAINDVLFLPAQGCYAASRLGGVLVAPSPHAQAWALRSGVVPAERQATTVQALEDSLCPFFDEAGWSVTEPLGMFAILEGLGAGNATTAALDLIRSRYGDLLAHGATTWWELYTSNQTRGHSLSHAWGTSPTWFLSSHVLGATMTGPASWRLAPHPGSLQRAEGTIPLGTTVLDVAWQNEQCGQFTLTLTAPPGTTGDVLLPILRRDAVVVLDGATIWAGGPTAPQPVAMTADGLLISGLAGGQHQVSATFDCQQSLLPLIVRH